MKNYPITMSFQVECEYTLTSNENDRQNMEAITCTPDICELFVTWIYQIYFKWLAPAFIQSEKMRYYIQNVDYIKQSACAFN
jgi:hypothetical protein